MNRFSKKVVKWVLFALFAVILIGGVAHAVSIDVFNKTSHSASGADETQQTYLKFNDRADSTSTWLKRDFNLNGTTVDLQAQTVDGTLVNNSDDTVKSWEMTINIEGDCFVNNAWVGTIEIHQFVGTDKEQVQTLDLRNYDLADVKLEYQYDGDLLIPLVKGDYLVYHPDPYDEYNIPPHAELTMGMIFYYLDGLDLSNHTIDYYYYRDFTYGISFIILVALAILWVLLLAGWLVADVSYNRAMRDMELRKSGLASMSGIYSIISIIDLKNNILVPVHASAKTNEALPEGSGAREKLIDIFARDTEEPFRAAVLEFVDTATLPERMDTKSIAFEYVSKEYGWSRIRFFAVDREEGQPLESVLLTIEDINDERRKLEQFEQQKVHAELETSTRGTFIAGVSDNMNHLVKSIDDLGETIAGETDDDAIRSHVKQLQNRNKLLSYLVDSVKDWSNTGAESVKASQEEYSFSAMVESVCDIAGSVAEEMNFTFESDISPSIADRLIGDERRVEQALLGVIVCAGRREGATTVRLSAYGAAHGNIEHILFSVKVDGKGMAEDAARLLTDFISDVEEYGVHPIDDSIQDLEGVALLLMVIGSKLQLVNEPGQGCELYFEIEQQIAES